MPPLVTVIITAFRNARYLNEAAESVRAQTFKDYDLIVVDDASGEECVRQYKLPPEARLIVHERNKGSAAASRNTGLREARGKYVAFMDHDDLWQPEKLAAQVGLMERHPDAAMVYSHYALVDESLRRWPKQPKYAPHPDPLREILQRNFIKTPSAVMVTRQALEEVGNFDETVVGAADKDLWLRLLRKHSMICTPEVLTLYRKHPGQLHRQERATRAGRLRAAEKALAWAQADRPELANLASLSLHNVLLKIAMTQWRADGNRAEALATIRRALSIRPWSPRARAAAICLQLLSRRVPQNNMETAE